MNGNTPLGILYQNFNRLRTKINDLVQSINVCMHKIIIFSETNLSGDIMSSELGLFNCNVFRNDRSSLTKRSRGGVLIAVHSDFSSIEVISSVKNVEHVFVTVATPGKKLLIGAIYIPPNYP